MNRIVINGKTYTFNDGANVSIINDSLYVDGKKIDSNQNIYDISVIKIEGNVNNIETDKSVNCGDVKGNINAGGSVNCDDIEGDVTAGGSVNCDDVGGSISAGGSVRCG